MKLGFLTACLRTVPLEDTVRWAGANGFDALELSCHPVSPNSPSQGELDVANLDSDHAASFKELCHQSGIEISCLTYCRNNLAPDPEERQQTLTHLRSVIDAAHLLGVATVSTFVGRDPYKTIDENIQEAVPVFRELLAYAGDKGVRIAIENCPMINWQREGLVGNIFHSPEVWERMFELLPNSNFGLNYDPSHLYWMGVDYIAAVRDFAERIFHVHAKDTEVFEDRVARGGMFLPSYRWWRYRMPGLGSINWPQFISALQEYGYDYVLSTEHEDPVWHGDPNKVKAGLLLGKKYLSIFVI